MAPASAASLLVFWSRVQSTSSGGFDQYTWRVTRVPNPDAAPSAWTFSDAKLPADSHGVAFAGGVMVDGGYLYAYGESDDASHELRLARWSEEVAATGDLSAPEWWCGDHWDPGSGASPTILVSLGPPELSVHHDGRIAPYVMVQTEGYGATTSPCAPRPRPRGRGAIPSRSSARPSRPSMTRSCTRARPTPS